MGLFGRFAWTDGHWDARREGRYRLRLDVHDSDIATVEYAPAPPGRGRLYLGYEPRDYFEDETASEPVDRPTEADAFAAWVLDARARVIEAADVLALLAVPGEEPDDLFVEQTLARLLALAGTGVPEDLQAELDRTGTVEITDGD